ncbi:hypothetical protein [Amycolatopsis sp. NPDC051128]|uniref:hypothetical protein n=1 Tax=Amycolatopsis sp. NPDC051128 TaxID=3155412 RepID=UPI00343F89BF
MNSSPEDQETDDRSRQRWWRLTGSEKKLFRRYAAPLLAVVGVASGIAQYFAQHANSGWQLLAISLAIVGAGGLAVLVVVVVRERGGRRVALRWYTIVIASVLLLATGVLGGVVGSSIADLKNRNAGQSTASSSTPPSAPASPASVSTPSSGSGPSVVFRVYSDVYSPPPVPGISIEKGQTVHVTQNNPSEKWACAQQETPFTGIEGAEHAGDSETFEVPGQNICLLLGKVGNEKKWRPIGPKFEFVAEESGALRLMVNEIPPDKCPYADKLPATFPNPHCYADNQGSIEVTVSVS